MQVSNFVIITAVEVYILLILISVFFIFHSRGQRQLIQRQQQKLRELAQAKSATTLNDTDNSDIKTRLVRYQEELGKQRDDATRLYQALASDQAINSSQPIDAPLTQKLLALRYQFLAAESNASYIEDDQIVVDWSVVEQHFGELLNSQQSPPDLASLQAELGISKKRIENLEKFKQLFFEMEKQWQDAKENAQAHYSQLAEMAKNVDDKAYFTDVLERYHNVYNEVSESIALGSGLEKHSNTIAYQTIKVNRTDPSSAKEIIKLRNVAVDQHRIISQLQRKLENATTTAEKEEAFNELQHQLDRQTRFVKEAETCVQLLEDELARSHEKIVQQDLALDLAKEAQDEKEDLKQQLHKFALENKELMQTISRLKQAQNIPTDTVEKNDKGMSSNKIKEDYLALQMRHAELEEKYLALKLNKKP